MASQNSKYRTNSKLTYAIILVTIFSTTHDLRHFAIAISLACGKINFCAIANVTIENSFRKVLPSIETTTVQIPPEIFKIFPISRDGLGPKA